MTTHVVLGGTGVVGRETIAALRTGDREVRAVSRTPSTAPESGVTPVAA
ncbi:NAD-dependent epimerase/dehydratase family protein, partial [Agromyces binzhouensis]